MQSNPILICSFALLLGIVLPSHHSAEAEHIVAWGLNTFGQCDVPEGDDFVAVAAAFAHSLALRSDGSLVMWGYSESPVPQGKDFVAIAAHGQYSVALRSDGSLACWSCFEKDRCFVPEGNKYVAIAAGKAHALALMSDGSLTQWRYKGGYDLDEVPEGNDFIAVGAGDDRSLALKSDGSIAVWGYGDPKVEKPRGVKCVAVTAGRTRAVGLRSDGSLCTFPYRNLYTPTRIPRGNGFTSIASRGSYNFAIRSDGSLAAWTSTSSGVLEGNIFKAIAVGADHDLALAEKPQRYIGRNRPISRRPSKPGTPAAQDIGVVTTEETPVKITLLAEAGISGEILYYPFDRPLHGTLSESNGTPDIIYTPSRSFYGVDSFLYGVRSGTLRSNYAKVHILVTNQPDTPVAQDIRILTFQNRPVEIDLVATDADADPLTYRIEHLPKNGSLELIDSAANIYLYTPKPDFNGQDSFTFSASDGSSSSNIAKGEIEVAPEPNYRRPVFNTSILGSLRIDSPFDIVVGRVGNLYVLSSAKEESKVLVFYAQLNKQRTMVVDADMPKGIALYKDHLYVADTGRNRLIRYTLEGELDLSFGINGVVGSSGTGEGEFDQPWGIAVGKKGAVYIADRGNDRIQVFDSKGIFKSAWRQKTHVRRPSGPPPGEISPPMLGLEMAAYRDRPPRFITSMGQIRARDRMPLNNPSGIHYKGGVGEGGLIVADAGNHRIKHMSCYSGYLYESVGEKGDDQAQFDSPMDACYDRRSNLLIVADTGNSRIQVLRLSSSGEFFSTETICLHQISDLNLWAPAAVATTREEEKRILYLADTGNDRVLKLHIQSEDY